MNKVFKIVMGWNKADVAQLVFFPLAATALSLVFKLNFLFTTILFFGVPSLYLSFRNPKLIKKTLIFAAALTGPMVFILDYPAYLDKSWFVPNSLFRFLNNGIPIEDVVWAFLWVYFAVIFWEYFLDTGKIRDKFSKNLPYLLILLVALITAFFLAYFLKHDLLYEPYFYLKLGFVFIVIPLVGVLTGFPRLIRKISLIAVYFFMVSFLAEAVGLLQNHWYFGGEHYLGMMNFFGHALPFDEMIFWWTLGVPGVVAWYEFFADDKA